MQYELLEVSKSHQCEEVNWVCKYVCVNDLLEITPNFLRSLNFHKNF